ncbi:hypothetical protein BJ742DRAFT_672708 [Cladochytrium replicatum]|nr:hypothetical protein BJ742DRAFT_672708 [Cladochytrium replicatum]
MGSTSAVIPSSTLPNWDMLRKQARTLENEVEQRLVSYSRLSRSSVTGAGDFVALNMNGGSSSSIGPSGSASAEAAELEIVELLKKLTTVVNAMGACLENVPLSVPTNPSMMHMLQRHRDILYDYSKEFKKNKSKFAEAREHAELLSSIHDDISSYKAGMGVNSTDYLLTERGRIDNSHKLTDMVLEQAYDTRDALEKQRNTMFGSRVRMGSILGRFPALNNVIGRIGSRKRRETMIMAGVITFCLIVFLWLVWR